MRRITFALLLPLFLAACDGVGPANDTSTATTAAGADARGGQDRIGICHRTSSTTNPWVLITVAAPAVRTHLPGHNDFLAGDPASPLDANCVPRQIVQRNGEITIELISEAAFLDKSELWLFPQSASPGPDQTPLQGTDPGRYIFRNDAALGALSSAPDADAGAASHTGPMYVIPAGTMPANTPLHFGLFVKGLYVPPFTNPQDPRTDGAWFFTGDVVNNFDGAIHALATPVSDDAIATVYTLGFEDLCLTPTGPAVCENTVNFKDDDFNDIVFRVTVKKV